jgi:hypothetical protein
LLFPVPQRLQRFPVKERLVRDVPEFLCPLHAVRRKALPVSLDDLGIPGKVDLFLQADFVEPGVKGRVKRTPRSLMVNFDYRVRKRIGQRS